MEESKGYHLRIVLWQPCDGPGERNLVSGLLHALVGAVERFEREHGWALERSPPVRSHDVPRDAEEPRTRRQAAVLDVIGAFPRLFKDLRGEVLRVGAGACA